MAVSVRAKNWYADLLEQVAEASVQPPTTKAGLIAYYQARYPAKATRKQQSWRQRIVADLANITGQKPKTLEKRFDSGKKGGKDARINNPEPRNKAQYEALARKIGASAPEFGYNVLFNGWISFSHCEKRKFAVNITGEFAAEVAQDNALIIPAMLLVYMEEDDPNLSLLDQAPSVGICTGGQESGVNDPEFIVTGNRQKVVQGHLTLAEGPARGRRFSFFSR